MIFKPNIHLSKEKAETLSQLFSQVESRPMTKVEYRFVKEVEWITQQKFWKAHLTKEGFEDYRNLPSRGIHGKYEGYVNLWNLHHSPLMRALE